VNFSFMPLFLPPSSTFLGETHETTVTFLIGINLHTGKQGIFPQVYATDLKFYQVDEETTIKQPQPKVFKLHFLGSMEVSHHRGSDVMVDAIQKVSHAQITQAWSA